LRVLDPGRVFNHVPGLQALPLAIDLAGGEEAGLELQIV
jgi:hypothetical protein